MRRYWLPGVLALAGLACLTTESRADFIFRGRLVSLRIGGGRPAQPPAALTQQPPPVQGALVPVEPPVGVPLEIAPPAPLVPLPEAPLPRVVSPSYAPPVGISRPVTLQELACTFRPECGNYEVDIVHPYTGCPVKVCFHLPPGCARVELGGCLRKKIEFDYGKDEIEIWFYRNGRVSVDYD